MKRALFAILISCLVQAAPATPAAEDEVSDDITATQDCAVAAGRKLLVAATADTVVLQEKGKTVAEANLPEEFNDAKSSINCKPGVVEIWSQAGFSCVSTIFKFTFAQGKLKFDKQVTEDPCGDSMQRAEAALKKGDALKAAGEAEGILYPDHYLGPDFEEEMLTVGRKQAVGLYEKKDKAQAGKVAEAVSSWAQSAFARCIGKEDTGRECRLKKTTAIGDYNDLAFLIDEAGKHALAEGMLREILSADPQRAVAILNLADALWEQGGAKQKEAKEAYQKYGKLVPAAKWPPRVKARAG